MPPWNGPRAKVQIRLSIQRLRTLQEKKLALAKKTRREIADLLVKGRVETARLRVEGLIQDDIYVELLELLELYSEALQARFNLLEAAALNTDPEPSISDAVCSIIYAAPRTELKELQVLREILMHKFGRNFSLSLQPSDPPPTSVPKRILSKLSLFIPEKELVDAYLGEIARGYGVNWKPDPVEPTTTASSENDDDGDGDEGGAIEKKDKDGAPANTSEEPSEPPAAAATKAAQPTAAAAPAPTPAVVEKEPTEEEELARRFEKLKNLR